MGRAPILCKAQEGKPRQLFRNFEIQKGHNMKQIIKYKSREDWLKNRSSGIGASEAGTVLGLNPWETPYQLWRRKKGIDPPKAENFAMVAGHILEDAVAQFYERETRCHIIRASTDDYTITNTDTPYMRVSPDRTFWRMGRKRSEECKSILECKTTQMKIDPDDLPKHWFCQLQMNLGVGEYKDGALAWLTAGREFGCRDIRFDPDFFGWMKGEITKFWKDFVEGDKEPPAYTAADVLLKCPLHKEGKTVEANLEVMQMLERLRTLKERAKELGGEQEEIECSLKMFMGDAESVIAPDGRTLATWKAPRPSEKFDARQYQADHPRECEPYIRAVQGARRLLVK